MREVRGFYVPDADEHLARWLSSSPEFAGGPTYQLEKFQQAFPHIKNFRHAVDVGAHCGVWTRVMARCFGKVTAFEPVPKHLECLMRNVGAEATIYACALGDCEGTVDVDTAVTTVANRYGSEATTMMAAVSDLGDLQVECRTLDSFELADVDFIKIDVEGYEPRVIRGAADTIARCRPTIVVEQKNTTMRYGFPRHQAAVDLSALGAVCVGESHGDYVMAFP